MARIARMSLDLAIAAGNYLRPEVAVFWAYAKEELVPPMTVSFFAGPAGKTLETTIGGFGNRVIQGMEGIVKGMDAAEAKRKEAKIAAAKAAEAKLKAKQAEEAQKRDLEEKVRKEKAAKQAEERKKEDEKKAASKKPEEPKKPAKSEPKAVKKSDPPKDPKKK